MECDDCAAPIRFDQSYHLLNLTEERREGQEIIVLDEVPLVRMCEGCAGSWDFRQGIRVGRSPSDVLVALDDLGHEDFERCSDCGAVLGERCYHSLNHYRETLRANGMIDVLEAAMVTQLCASCRLKYDFAAVRLAPGHRPAGAL